jgi:hypothetical protein
MQPDGPIAQHDAPIRPHRRALLAATVLATIVAVAVAGALGRVRVSEVLSPPPAAVAVLPAAPPPPPERFEEEILRLGRDETVSQALARARLDAADVNGAIQALGGLFPFRKARPGDQLRVERRLGEPSLHRLTIRQGSVDEWRVEAARSSARSAT